MISPSIPRPRVVLFDLFHTLVCVPSPASLGQPSVSEILGVPSAEWLHHFYEADTHGRALGRVVDAVEAMRLVAHSIDPTIPDERIHRAVAMRQRCFELGLIEVEPPILDALDRLRAAGIRTGLVSDAAADDVESWDRSPLVGRLDVTVFSYQVGVRKPDARIYRLALDALGVSPAQALFVGDGGSNEHRGARELGMQTVLVTRLAGHWPSDVFEARRPYADFELPDVPALIEALGL
ncbi:MAG TPA: HAD-IA family hydrolase [Vicinamibacterales bacterium]